jgi:hypothetical protein
MLRVSNAKMSPSKLVESLRKSARDMSFEESEIDGLIKWAKNLPDDIANNS